MSKKSNMSGKSDELLSKITHDIECNSNVIKRLIPDLITRIEFNKLASRSDNPLSYSSERISKINSDTISFVEHLERYSNEF